MHIIIARAEVHEADLMTSYFKALLSIKLALPGDLVHLLTHGTNAVASM